MELAAILIWAVLIAIVVGVLIMVVSGIRNLIGGKFRMWSLLAMVIPIVLFVIGYLIYSGSTYPLTSAMIFTVLAMIVVGIGAIALTAAKGFIGF